MVRSFRVARVKVERNLSNSTNIKMEVKLTNKTSLKVFDVPFQPDYVIV